MQISEWWGFFAYLRTKPRHQIPFLFPFQAMKQLLGSAGKDEVWESSHVQSVNWEKKKGVVQNRILDLNNEYIREARVTFLEDTKVPECFERIFHSGPKYSFELKTRPLFSRKSAPSTRGFTPGSRGRKRTFHQRVGAAIRKGVETSIYGKKASRTCGLVRT